MCSRFSLRIRLASYPDRVPFREVIAYVLLPLVAEQCNDGLEFRVGLEDLPCGYEVGAARRADEEAVLPRESAHLLYSLLGVNGQGGIDQVLVALENAGHEAVSDAFYQVVPHLAAQDGRRLRGFHCEELDARVCLPERLAHPDQGPPRTYAHHQSVRNGAFGQLSQDLRAQPYPVLLHVPLALELGRAEVAGLLPELSCFGQGFVDVEVSDLHYLGPESAADGDPLAAHPLGHHDEHPVAFDRGDHREGVARVARRGLDDGIATSQESLVLGAFDHVLRYACFDGPGRVQVLEFAVDALDLEHRSVSYIIEDAVGKHAFHADHLRFRGNVCP